MVLKKHYLRKNTRIRIYNTLTLSSLLQDNETWTMKGKGESRIRTAEMKFIMWTVKCTWKDYNGNQDIWEKLKTELVLTKIQTTETNGSSCQQNAKGHTSQIDDDVQTVEQGTKDGI